MTTQTLTVSHDHPRQRTSPAFLGAAWTATIAGLGVFLFATYNATGLSPEGKWLLASLALWGLFGTVALSKSVRDREADLRLTWHFLLLSWLSALLPVGFLAVYLLTVDLPDVNKALFFVSYLLALFGTASVSKAVRDDAEAMGQDHG